MIKVDPERDREICRLYLSGEMKMPQIAKQFNLTRPRVHQILKDNGITTDRKEIEKRQSAIASQIEDITRQQPTISKKEIAANLDLSVRTVSYLISKFKIKLNKSLIVSHATTERRRKGRKPLTFELLYSKYVVEEKSQIEIARELGYSQQTISVNLRRHGIIPRTQ